MTEQGAAADNAVRDGAPGGAGPFARAPRPGTPTTLKTLGPGILALAFARPAWRRFAPSAAPPGAPFPFLGETEKGKGAGLAPDDRGRWITPARMLIGCAQRSP